VERIMVHATLSSVVIVPLVAFGFAYTLNMPLGSAEPGDVSGVYRCTGSVGDDKPYSGIVVIEKWGESYHLQWYFPAGLAAVGVGVLNGDALAVSYVAPAVGVILYRLDGQQLTGRWTQPEANGAVFSETLTLIPGGEIREELRRHRDLHPTRIGPGLQVSGAEGTGHPRRRPPRA
jgi:hypothetical protein